MTRLVRGMVIRANLNPTRGSESRKTRPCIIVTNDVYNARVPVIQIVPVTAVSAKKAKIITNVVIEPSKSNGLSKRSIADCLQTRPIDHRIRFRTVLGRISDEKMKAVDQALKVVLALD